MNYIFLKKYAHLSSKIICGSLLIAITASLSISSVRALTFSDMTISELFDQAQIVAHVRISKATLAEKKEAERVGAFFEYNSQAIEYFKGDDSAELSFHTYESLNIGHEYVLFLHGKEQHTVNPMLGDIFEFYRERGMVGKAKWLKNSASHIIVPEGVKTLKVEFASETNSEYYFSYYTYDLIAWDSFKNYLRSIRD